MKNCLFLNSDSVGVKICGLQDEECVEVAVGSGADAIGFVFGLIFNLFLSSSFCLFEFDMEVKHVIRSSTCEISISLP